MEAHKVEQFQSHSHLNLDSNSIDCLFTISLVFALILMIFFLLLTLDLICTFSPSFLSSKVQIVDFRSFPFSNICAFNRINFSLSIALIASLTFW